MARFHSRWFRNWLLGALKKQGRRSAKRLRPRLEVELFEDRVVPSVVGPFDGSQVTIPLGSVKAGQTALLMVNFSTTDNVNPNDRTEGEPLVIDGPGYHNEIYAYGTQTVQVPVTQDGEQLTAYVQGGDGDESATVTPITLTIANPTDPGGTSPAAQFNITAGSATTAPSMPDIPALADLEGADAASTVFTWKADVKFDPTSASGGGATGVIEQVYTSTPITGASVTFNNDNMWNNVIRGGNVTLTVSATVDGVQLTSDPVHFNIEGSNPGSAAVKGFIELQAVPANWPSGSSYTYSSIMEKIANLESGHTFNQFTADGNPLYNQTASDGGVGIMQLTPPSNNDQVWNWQANVLGGLAVFQGKLNAAVSWVNTEVATAQGLAQTYMQQHHLTSFSIQGTPNATVKEAIKRYNGGIGYVLSVNRNSTLAAPSIQGQTLILNWVAAQSNDGSYVSLVLSQSDPLVVTTQPPANVTAGTPFGLVVTAENEDGSVNTSFNGSLTVTLNNYDYDNPGGTLGGTLTVPAVNGIATFSGLTVDQASYYYALTITSDSLPAVTTNDFNVTAAAATQLVVQNPGNVIANAPFALEVDAEDPYNNPDPTFNGPITVALGDNPGGSTLGGTLTVTAYDGVADFDDLTIDNPASGYTLTATSPGLTSNTSPAFYVTDQLAVTTQPPIYVRAGSGFNLVVAAEDGLGNVDTSFDGSVTLALNDYYGSGATLDGTLTETAINGVATFSGLTLDQAPNGDYYSLSVSAAGLPATASNGFYATTAAPATQVVVQSPSGNVVTNATFDLEVDAEDPNGNVDPLFNGNVTVSLGSNPGGSTLGGTLTVAAVNGVADFDDLTIDNPANGYTLTATSPGLTSNTSAPFDVTDQLVVTTQPPNYVRAGSGFNLVVAAEDGLGNVDTSFDGSVTLALNDYDGSGATLGGTLTATAVNGVATFSGLTLNQAQAQVQAYDYFSLSVSAAGLPATASNGFYATTAAPATQLVVSAPASFLDTDGDVFAGSPFSLQVQAEDPNGNVDPTFNGPVTLALGNNPGGSSLSGTLTATASGGVAVFDDLTLSNSGSGYTLLVSSTGLTAGTSLPFNVSNDQLVVTTQPPDSTTAGTPLGLVVTAENVNGQVDTSFNGNVTVALGNMSGGPDNILGGTLTVTAVNGVATFSGLTVNQVGQNGYYDLEVSSNGLTDTYTTFYVTAAPATQLVVTAQPASITAGAGFEVDVAAEDANGNVDPSYNGSVTLALETNPAGGTLGGTLTATVSGGVATFPGLTIDNAGNGYTIQATASGLTSATTSAIDVTALGVANQLVLTSGPPGNVTAGTGFGLVVSAEDSNGTVDTSFSGLVTVALSGATSGSLGGMLTVSAVNGVATFSDLTLDQTGSYGLSVSSNGLSGTTTGDGSITVNAAAASQLVISGPNGNVFPGIPFGLEVNAEDPYGNVDTTFNGSVTVALGNNPGGGTLGGTLTATASSGVASFDLTISNAGSGYSLQASSNGLPTDTSSLFDVISDQLVVTTQPPTGVTTANSFGLVVAAEDGLGNVDTSFNGPVTVALGYGNFTATLGGTLTVSAVNGVATFSGLTLNQPGTYALSVSGNGMPGTTTSLFNVTVVATQLAVITPPPATVTAGAGFEMDVAAEDALGNVATTFDGSITLALANNPAGGTLGGTLTATAVNGVADFPGLTINNPGKGYTIQATTNGLTSATSTAIDVTPPGVATQLVVTTQPPVSVTAGTGFGLVVTADDSLGTVDTSFDGSVTVALSNNTVDGTLDGILTVTAVNGVATFSGLTLDQAGDNYSLSATSDPLTPATTNPFNVTPAAATQLFAANPSGNVLTGSPFSLAVSALDPYGNVATSFGGSVTLALGNNAGGGTLGGTLTTTAVNGVANFFGLTISSSGNGYTIQGSSNGLSSGTTLPFDVTSDQLVVTTQPPSSVTAGTGFGLVVSAEDNSGTVDTSFNGSVTVALSDSLGDSSDLGGTVTVTAVNGVATFSGLTVQQADSYTLSVTGTDLGGATTNPFDVTAAAATQLVVTTQPPVAVTAGAGFNVTVAAEDPYGNVDPTFDGSVTVALGNNPASGTLGGTLTVTAVNGVANFSGLTIDNPGNGYTLRATANGLTPATTTAIDVTGAGVATQLVVTTQPPVSVAAGSGFGLVVSAEDSSGNVATSFDGSVTVDNPNGGTPLGETTAVNGVATFTGLTLDQSGEYSLTVTSNGLAQATTNSFNVNPLAASQLVVLDPLTNVLPGAPFNLDVLAEDMYGNVATTFNGSVTLALGNNPGSATLGGTLTVSASNGVASYVGLTIGKPGIGYTITATTSGLPTGTSLPFDVTSDQLVVTTQPPSSVAAGTSFGFVVTAENNSGSVDTSFNGSTTVALISFGSNTPPLGGTLTVTAVNGVATFSGLTLDPVGVYGLSVVGDGVGGAVTNDFSVTAAAATQLVVTTQPPAAVAPGAAFGTVVSAEDQFDNVDTAFSGSVTVALDNNPTGTTLGGTLTVGAVAGQATFSGLTLDAVGNGYTLQATASHLTPATTQSFDVSRPGIATQLVVITSPQTLIAGQPSAPITVELEDSFGNAVPAGPGGLPLTLSTTSPGGTFLTIDFSIPQGDSTGSFQYEDTLAGTPTLKVAAPTFSTTQQETVVAAAPDAVVFLTAPQTLTAGQPSAPIEVQLEDQYGNVAQAGSGGLILTLGTTSPGGTFLTIDLTIPQGESTGSFQYKDTLAGSPTLKVAAPTFSATQQETVIAAAPDAVVFTTAPQTLTAGQPSAPIAVELQDQYGNVAVAGPGGVVLTLSSTSEQGTFLSDSGQPLGDPSLVVASGASTASFEYEDTRAGTPTLKVAAATFQNSQQETVKPAAPEAVFTTPPQTMMVDQDSTPIEVQLQDQYGNLIQAGAGGLTFRLSTTSGGGTFLSDSGQPLADLTVAQGASTASFEYKDAQAGTPTLTLTATGLPPAMQQETILPATPVTFTNPSTAVFPVGQADSFLFTTTSDPTAALSESGLLPQNVKFVDNGNGTATLSGSPLPTTGLYTFDVTGNNGDTPAVTQVFTLTVVDPPIFTSAASTTFTTGSAGSFTVTTTAGLPTTTTLTKSGTLPGGMSFTDNGNGTATLKGTPAAGTGGTYALTLTASNGVDQATQSFTLTVDQAPAITSSKTASFTVGQSGTFTVTTSGFPKPTLGAGALPSGLTFIDNHDGTATISGTPAAGTTGAHTVNLTASNGVGSAATQTLTLTINQAPAFSSVNHTTFTVGQLGTFTVTTTPGFPTATTVTKSGTLPQGVSFTAGTNGTATLKGTPAAGTGGTYALTLTASNSAAQATQSFTLTIDQAPAITSSKTASFTVGQAGTFTVTTSGFPTPTLSAGVLPSGLTFTDNGNGTATIKGTPAAGTTGTHTVNLTASNGVGSAATQTLTLTINQAPAFASVNHATFTVGQLGTFNITTTPGVPAATTVTKSGTLPQGVSFTAGTNGTATIKGTPAAGTGGTYTLTLTASNGVAQATQTFTLTVDQAPAITSSKTASFTVGQSGTFTVTTSGFPKPTLGASTLPSGLTFTDNHDGTATISGTPATGTTGTHTVNLTASNGVGNAATQALALTINQAPAFTSAANATFTVGQLGTFNVTTTPGVPAATTVTKSGTLPQGVSFTAGTNGTATLKGTPAAGTGGTYALTLTASNGVAQSTQTFTLTVDQAPAITSSKTTSFTVGTSGTFTVTTSGFPKPALARALPSGLTFTDNGNGTATLSGTPAAGTAGTHTVNLTASNSVGSAATQTLTLTIDQAPAFASANNATFTVGQLGTFNVTTTPGVPAATTVTKSGTLPQGVSFTAGTNGTATLKGTPAAGTGGAYTLTLTASNGVAQATQSFTLTVDQAPAITSSKTASFTVGTAGTFTVTTSGFPKPTLGAGALPSGLTFTDNHDGTATISGTPAAGTTGNVTVNLTASNGVGSAATQALVFTINQPPIITSGNNATFTVGQAGSFTVTATGFPNATLTESGTLPHGVSFTANSNGTATLKGTPAAGTGGTYALAISASNGVGVPSRQLFTLTVDEAPAITSAKNATFTVGKAGSFTVSTTGLPVAALGESGSLPGGLHFLDNGDGTATLSGIPAAGSGGTYTLTFNASNGTLPAATQTFTLTVDQALAITSATRTTFTASQNNSFTITTTGFPVATLSKSGTLPAGVTFVNNGDGTATLKGKPAAGTHGSFTFTITASDSVLPAVTQDFDLTVG